MAGDWLVVALGVPADSLVTKVPSARAVHLRLGRMELRVLTRVVAAAAGQTVESISGLLDNLDGSSVGALLGDGPVPRNAALGGGWVHHSSSHLPAHEASRYFRAPSRVVFEHPRVVHALAGAFFWKTCKHVALFTSTNARLLDAQYLPTELAMEGEGTFFEERLIAAAIDLGAIPRRARVDRIVDDGGWADVSQLTASITFEYVLDGQPGRVTLTGTAIAPPPPQRPEAEARRIEQEHAQLSSVGIYSSLLSIQQAVVYQLRHQPLAHALAATPSARSRLLSQATDIAAALDAVTRQGEPGPEPLALVLTTPEDLTAGKLTSYLSTDGATVFWADAMVSPWSVATKLPTSRSPFLKLLLAEVPDAAERLMVQRIYTAAMRAGAHAQ